MTIDAFGVNTRCSKIEKKRRERKKNQKDAKKCSRKKQYAGNASPMGPLLTLTSMSSAL